MNSKRRFIQTIALLLGASYVRANTSQPQYDWFMPEESETHKRTWMAFIASDNIWEKRQIVEVQNNLANIATTIANYEPVSMLYRNSDYKILKKLLGDLNTYRYPIKLIPFEMNDLWMRDTSAIFVLNEKGQKAAINFNFNGWGEKQVYDLDAKVADFVAKKAQVTSIRTELVLEGGCFEVDGQGTAIMSESCILNKNRNPHKNKSMVEQELKQKLGLDKIIWLKGIKGKDITDGHTDFYARFAKAGTVVVSRDTDRDSFDYAVTRENIAMLKTATDAQGKPLKLIILDTPWDINTRYGVKDFATGYVGYYICNGAVIMQKFGDKKADQRAKEQLAQVFPNHVIEQIAVDGIASGGGSIHCATQQEPLV